MSFFPAFTVTGKLKAHGSSQACFEFADPGSPHGGLRGRLALGRVHFEAPLAVDGQVAGKAGQLALGCERQAARVGPSKTRALTPAPPAGPSLSEGGPRSSGRLQAQDKLKPEPRGCWKPQNPVCSYSADSALPPAPTARPLIGKLMAGLGGQQEASGRVWASLASPLCDPGRRFSQARQSDHQGVLC